jgi:hypothetical protein
VDAVAVAIAGMCDRECEVREGIDAFLGFTPSFLSVSFTEDCSSRSTHQSYLFSQ